jgi:hypothetical protein
MTMTTMTTESGVDVTLGFLLLVLVGIPVSYMISLVLLKIWKE